MHEASISFVMGRLAWAGMIPEIERRAEALDLEVLETVERKHLLSTDVQIRVRGTEEAVAALGEQARSLIGGVRVATVDAMFPW